jgi:heterogeneous nuclear ribonucleoprotein A1/A3
MADYCEDDTREQEAMRKMFVGGLNRSTSDEAFFEYFGQFGTMVDQVVIKDMETKESRGFGFITYDRSDAVESVFQGRPHILDNKTLDVKRAMPREFNTSTSHAKVSKLFVGGIYPELTEEKLKEYIESRHPTSFGCVEKITFLKDDSGKNKKFGFLECTDTDFADRLTISENQFMIDGRSMHMKKADQKEQGGAGGPRRGGGRGAPRGGRGFGPRGAGRGVGRGGSNRGSFNRGGFNQGANYNYNQNGYQQSGYGDYPQTGYPQYQNQSYNQGYTNQYSQYGQGQYGQYDQSQSQSYGSNQGYGANQGNNRFTPY